MKKVKKSKLKPSTIGWPKNYSLEKVGITQSLWSTYYSCPRAFLLKLNGYGQPLKEEKVHFGNLAHQVCDEVLTIGKYPTNRKISTIIDTYTEKRIKEGTMLTHQQMETDAAKCHATMIAYFEFYENDFKNKEYIAVEHLFQEVYNGCLQRGKIDGAFRAKNKKKWLLEHKTKGRINENSLLLHLPMDFQNLFYIVNDFIDTGEMATGVLYDVIRNSGMKVHKNESLKAYFKRILEACRSDQEHSFKRWEVTYSPEEVNTFQIELTQHINKFRQNIGNNVLANRFSCTGMWDCEFLRACSEDSMSCLSKSKEKIEQYLFPELKEEGYNASKKDKSKAGQKSKSKKTARRKVAKRKA